MSDSPNTLAARIETVCGRRGFSERAWCKAAGLSEGYLATQRAREVDEGYVLPEKAALRLAAAANVYVEWLRFGQGPMAPNDEVRADTTAAVSALYPPSLATARHAAVTMMLTVAGRLHELGDHRGMAVVMDAIRALTSLPDSSAVDDHAESMTRRKVSL